MIMTRREALKTSTAAAFLGASGILARAAGANEKLNIVCVGIGGQGTGNVKAAAAHTLIGLCDVDSVRAGKVFETYPNVKRFVDFRKMFDELEKQIDAVVVSTPDHTHFHPAYWALQRGKHLYLEKPMAHNVWEVRKLTDLAREKKIATQLGNQRHAIPNMARVVELIRAKAIGDVTEVHSWIGTSRGDWKDPDHPATPATLNWDLWVGPAKDHGYSPQFAPYNWRFFWDYGTGEAGNWGCHILDIPFWALGLKYPTKVSATNAKPDPMKTPSAMATHLEFPAVGSRKAVTLHWYQGKPSILKEKGIDEKNINNVFIGTDGILAAGFAEHKLYPVEKFKDYKAPEKSIPASPGFHKEWLAACKGGPAATCNFDYTGPMSETVLLANVAFRAGGKAFEWDATTMTAKGNDAVAPLLKEEFRKGWEI
ncbi:Gfo/Idh/MocA family oxidoreductase [soil metagenome]